MAEKVTISAEEAMEPLKELEPVLGSTPIAPAHGIATIALTMAMKYHDINTVQDGTLYQQYKLEGKNMRPLHLDEVFQTAEQIEKWLLLSQDRIAKIVFDAISADDGRPSSEAQKPGEAQDGLEGA